LSGAAASSARRARGSPVERGIDLYVLNRGSTQQRPLPEQATVLRADIRDRTAVAEALGRREFDAVVNWVAFTPDQVQADIDLLRGGPPSTCSSARRRRYQTPPARPPVLESTPLRNPFWRYSRDKIACEDLLVKAYRDDGFPATIVRPLATPTTRPDPARRRLDRAGRMRQGRPS